jgi:hypothetical protein
MITKIFNIDDYRMEVNGDNHGLRFSSDTTCPHRNLFFDENGQTVECKDCKKQVTAWWALITMASGLKRMRESLEADRKQLEEERAQNLTHKAAIAVEKAWRKHKMVPACPHCLHAIGPEDGFGHTMLSKEDSEGARRHMISTCKTLGMATGQIK